MAEQTTWDGDLTAPYSSEEMIAAPLADRLIGLRDSNFVFAEYSDIGNPNASSGTPIYIAPFHIHHSDDEAWYVLEGKLAFRLGEEVHEAASGTAVFVPRGTAHTYWNPTPNLTRYLLIMTPRIRDLIAAIHASTARDRASMEALFRRYDSTLIDLLF